ncbi:MAG: hypothetical protein H8M99_02315 [Gloeobacteraceae cyanobacterium ES-bin-144]|nr:hypothetical protein [Verrucomicrobiales bacterium]
MNPKLKRLLPLLFLIACGILTFSLIDRENPSLPEKDPTPLLPTLLPPRKATASDSIQSWERLLAEDGTPQEDRNSLADIVSSYLQTVGQHQRQPLGTNEEITRALTDKQTLADSAIPSNHPAILSGRLVDRWGSPWFFHQLSADFIEVRSAGPDRKLFSDDDVK